MFDRSLNYMLLHRGGWGTVVGGAPWWVGHRGGLART